jgi:transglutaminase-like putative cysteine protease
MTTRPSTRVALLGLVLASALARAEAPLSDVLKVPRPAGGEYLGLYLKGQKVGYMFSDLTLSPGKDTVTVRQEVHFKAKVSRATAERHMVETKVYQARPGGKLLSFVAQLSGDGGEQTLEGTATATGLRVLRKRPGKPNETLSVQPSREVVEDADQARVALLRGAPVEGIVTDTMDLEQYRVSTTLSESQTRTLGGVKVKLRHVQSISDKEKVPADVWLDEAGRTVEVHYGPVMTGVAEPADVAKRVDLVEIFALSRVTLPGPLPASARQVPGRLQLVMTGLPEKFQVDSARQTFRRLADGKVEVTISSRQPRQLLPRPLRDPAGGEYLKTSIVIESDAPEIKALAKRLAGDEKDALTVARKVSSWVNEHLAKDYGVSSDRATDVLKLMKGDCTEHSLLTVSLLRALGIPAKRIDGVVYLVNEDGVPALYWHEWVEAYVGEWTQLDPTFGQDVADATHFAVGEEARSEITPLIGSLQVLEVR